MRATTIAGVAVGIALWAGAPASAAPVPEGAEWTQATIVSADGTRLHADVLRPKGVPAAERVPVIVNVGPYNGSGPFVHATVNRTPPDGGPGPGYSELYGPGGLFERGYAYVQVDLRGYGGSEGCGDLFGPRERDDVKAAVEWAASQPWSNGRIGMYGRSYEGWTGLAALATRAHGLAAVVAEAPVVSLRRSHEQYDAGVPYQWMRLAPLNYVALQADPSVRPGEQVASLHGPTTEPDCYASQMAGVQNPGPSEFWARRDLAPMLAGSRVPVLYSQGFLDPTARADQALVAWPLLGRRVRAWAGQFGHTLPDLARSGRDGFVDQALDFFDQHVAQLPRPRPPRVTVQDSDGRWRAERVWPPRDARRWKIPVRAGSYRSEDRNYGEPTIQDPVTRVPAPAPPRFGIGTWTATRPWASELRIAGAPRVRLSIASAPAGAQVIALLYDIDPSGRGLLIARGPRRLAGPGDVTVEMSPQDWRVPPGHRLALLLSGADDTTYEPAAAAGEVLVDSGTLSLPRLKRLRTTFLDGGPSPAIGARGAIRFDNTELERATVEASDEEER